MKSVTAVVPTSNQDGATAPLTEDGYQAVAVLSNDAEMKRVILRNLREDGLIVKQDSETYLDGLPCGTLVL